MNIILEGVVGSRAHGLSSDSSDKDTLGVFVAPTSIIAGLDWSAWDETEVWTSSDGDDYTYHEVGKFIRLILKCNPSILELLFLPSYEKINAYGKLLVDTAPSMISYNRAHASYLGFAESTARKFSMTGKIKDARNSFRILEQGTRLLTTGKIDVKVGDSYFYRGLSERSSADILTDLSHGIDVFKSRSPETGDPEAHKNLARRVLHLIREEHPFE